jgi:hypothetical protein
MTFRRTTTALCLAMVIVLAVAVLSRPDRRQGGSGAVATAPSAAAGAGNGPIAAAAPGASEGAQRLDAVRTVNLFCDLVGSRRFWRAAALFATPRVWPRRKLRAVLRLDFRSARIGSSPDPRTLVVIAQVQASGGSGSPVRDGNATLFFTLGRVGTTAGGWLITAVTTSP